MIQRMQLRTGKIQAALVLVLTLCAGAAQAQMSEFAKQDRQKWRDAEHVAGGTIMILDDGLRETGPGLEISGPDPFRMLGGDQKTVPHWRLGISSFDVSDPGTGVSSELMILRLSAGVDYHFRRRFRAKRYEDGEVEYGPDRRPVKIRNTRGFFLSSYLEAYIPERDINLPGNREDSTKLGLSLGGGLAVGRLRLRFDHTFLQGNTSADTLGFGYTF